MVYAFLVSWYSLTVAMAICFVICIMLIVTQIKSFHWYATSMDDDNIFKKKREHFCLYGAYILASICSLQCLMNHISNYLPDWYCIYGMSICVVLHEAAKTFGYGFFLERAKSAISSTKTFILPPIITKYVLPIYISFYFVLYSILCPLTFRGLSIDIDPKVTSSILTSCLFDEYESWVFYLSVGVEVFNSIFFVFLFAYPLYKITKQSQQDEVKKIIKYNIIFSSISCTSSVTFLLYRALAKNNYYMGYYLWLSGNIDLVINAICTFLMVTANRKYLDYINNTYCCGQCCNACKHRKSEEDTSKSHSLIVLSSKKRRKDKINNNDMIDMIDMTVSNISCIHEHESLLQMDSLVNTNPVQSVQTLHEKYPHIISEPVMESDSMAFNVDKTLKGGGPKTITGSRMDSSDETKETMRSLPKLNASVTAFNLSRTFG